MDAADQFGPDRVISATGVPTSAGADRAGQDLAPAALRERNAGEVVAAATRLAEETG